MTPESFYRLTVSMLNTYREMFTEFAKAYNDEGLDLAATAINRAKNAMDYASELTEKNWQDCWFTCKDCRFYNGGNKCDMHPHSCVVENGYCNFGQRKETDD